MILQEPSIPEDRIASGFWQPSDWADGDRSLATYSDFTVSIPLPFLIYLMEALGGKVALDMSDYRRLQGLQARATMTTYKELDPWRILYVMDIEEEGT